MKKIILAFLFLMSLNVFVFAEYQLVEDREALRFQVFIDTEANKTMCVLTFKDKDRKPIIYSWDND